MGVCCSTSTVRKNIKSPQCTGTELCGLPDSIRLLPVKASASIFYDEFGRSIGSRGSILSFNFTTVVSIDLSSRARYMFQKIQIARSFCTNMPNLTTLNLSGLFTCRWIGANFCKGCPRLRTVYLTGMSQCMAIQDGFCSQCPSLTSLHLGEMPKCQVLGKDFCSGCTSLIHLDISGMRQCAVVGDKFCADTSLITINISFLGEDAPTEERAEVIKQLRQLRNLKLLRTIHADMTTGSCFTKHEPKFSGIVDVGEAIISWSWRTHYLCPRSVRVAVLSMFEGVAFTHHSGEQRFLPSEVALQICAHIM